MVPPQVTHDRTGGDERPANEEGAKGEEPERGDEGDGGDQEELVRRRDGPREGQDAQRRERPDRDGEEVEQCLLPQGDLLEPGRDDPARGHDTAQQSTPVRGTEMTPHDRWKLGYAKHRGCKLLPCRDRRERLAHDPKYGTRDRPLPGAPRTPRVRFEERR